MDVVRKHQESETGQHVNTEIPLPPKNERVPQLNKLSPYLIEPEEEIDFFELMEVVWKWKYFILLVMCIGVVSTSVFTYITNKPSYITEVGFSLNFSGIEKHKNPDGSAFEKSQVISPNILSGIPLLRLSETNDPTDWLSIDPILPQDILEALSSKEKKSDALAYFPNKYLLSLTTKDENIIPASVKSEILLSIIMEYKKDFRLKYVDPPLTFSKLSHDFLKTSDYQDTIGIIDLNIDNMIAFLDDKIKEAGSFRSTSTNLSFSNLRNDFILLKRYDLVKAKSITENLSLTKNQEQYIIHLKESIKNIEIEKEKAAGTALIARKLLQTIVSDKTEKTGVIKIPSNLALESSFIESLRKEDSLSYLLKYVLKFDTLASDMEIEQKKLRRKLAYAEQRDKINAKGDTQDQKLVDNMLSKILLMYNEIIEQIRLLNDEFLNLKYSNSIQIFHSPFSFTENSRPMSLKIMGLTVAVSLFLSLFFVFFYEFIKKNRKIEETTKN
ncbi:hypothetical protein KKA14_08740 [bacterium]|nr:hypothetical protein [bacterium]